MAHQWMWSGHNQSPVDQVWITHLGVGVLLSRAHFSQWRLCACHLLVPSREQTPRARVPPLDLLPNATVKASPGAGVELERDTGWSNPHMSGASAPFNED